MTCLTRLILKSFSLSLPPCPFPIISSTTRSPSRTPRVPKHASCPLKERKKRKTVTFLSETVSIWQKKKVILADRVGYPKAKICSVFCGLASLLLLLLLLSRFQRRLQEQLFSQRNQLQFPMFVKKLVEKASKKSGGSREGLKPDDVDPRLVFHYGIPSGSASFAYDSVQKILAVSTRDGRIKLFGKENTQALLESYGEKVPSKFLLFMENQGFILNVTANNHIEVWDIDKKRMSYVNVFKDEITSFTLVRNGPFMLVGDSAGNVSVLKLEQKPVSIVQMKYTIPFSSSHGSTTEANGGLSVTHLLLQPGADTRRLLVVFSDGLVVLWGIRESKSIFTTGGKSMLSLNQEAKKVTAACWGCPFGSKVIVGYSNGEILIWNILPNQFPNTELTSSGTGNPTALPSKLNLGYKLDKTPISSLRWDYADGKASRLYIVGASEFASPNSVQVVLLNEYTESRTIKLGLQLLETCSDLAIISSFCEQSKNKQDLLLLLGKSGRIYAYDDCLIEKYLLQSQSSVAPSLPKEVMVKMPFTDSTITVAKIITENSILINNADEDYRSLAKNFPPLFLFETKPRDSSRFRGFSMVDNLYITGHSNGAVTFWDASCPFFVPILSLHQQSDDDFSLSGIAVTALHFDSNSRLLVSGDQSGMVRIFWLRPESFVVDNSFMPFQGSLKKKNNHIVQSVNLVKVGGSILVMNVNQRSTRLAVGSDQGIVAVIDIKESNIIYQKHVASGLSTGIISLHFEHCSLHGFEKNILAVVTKDSSIFALDDDTGSTLSTGMISPKKPSRALFMQILGEQNSSDAQVSNSANQLSVLLCSEKAAYVYSFSHAIQGVKKVQYKKKFQSSCSWATTFYSSIGVGLVLLFNNGKTEIRSLPELSLVKETSFGGVTYSASNTVMCSSRKGDIVLVNSDQELFVVSISIHKEIFRLVDSASHIYRRDLNLSHEKPVSDAIVPKEKKKGIFNSVMKEVTGNKAKQAAEVGKEDSEQCNEDLSVIFSANNFPGNVENRMSQDILAVREEDVGLDIDDIDLDDSGEKHKEQKLFSALNKQTLAGKLNAFKGRLKHMNLKSPTDSTREEELDRKQESKTDSIDQIKRKYGYGSSDETSIARMTESKLHDNLRKLQGINERATEMQGSAKSFSSMASDMLRIAQQGRRNSS